MEDLPKTLPEFVEFFFFYGLVFAFTLALIIVIHEFGHYLAAKYCRVRVQKFSIGFGREIVGFHDKSGTRWSLSIFPIGGFVTLFGDVDRDNPVVWDAQNNCEKKLTTKELEQAFCTKTIAQRAFIIFAGPLINLLFSFLILIALYCFYGQGSTKPIINILGIGTASYEDGFQLGDKILKMNGKHVRRFEDIYDHTRHEPDIPFDYEVERNGEILTITSAARSFVYVDKKGVKRNHGRTGMGRFGAEKYKDFLSIDGIPVNKDEDKARKLLKDRLDKVVTMGIALREEAGEDTFLAIFPSKYNQNMDNPEHNNYEKIYAIDPEEKYYLPLGPIEATKKSAESIKNTMVRAYKLFRVAYKGHTDEPVLGGVVKMSEQTGKVAKAGFHNYIHFLAIISFTIGLINLLPIPMLDGGFLVFLMYELVAGKQVPPRVQSYAFAIGLVLLGGIMILANLGDLLRLLV